LLRHGNYVQIIYIGHFKSCLKQSSVPVIIDH